MRTGGKNNILGILIDAADYDGAIEIVINAAREKRPLAVSALAVHGLMTGVLDNEHKYRLNRFDLLVPDGQPVRWALNTLHGVGLKDRVYGPRLTLRTCEAAEREELSIFFYGTTPEILKSLHDSLRNKYPNMKIAGMEPSKFRRLNPQEKIELADRIRASGASMVFVGLGCPRQEAFAYEFRDVLGIPILAVGAAFPFIAELLPQAPLWMQDAGLEWLYRLMTEPRRLWRRYLFLNSAYLALVVLQALRISKFSPDGRAPSSELLYG
jgi:N-acetylglucosaminyldiphosphoundecaprenol N-acetyl-beta-D-mannosaminyltransferase